ncbi:unnamed protein product [Linum trigynum]|uniref:Uncharacterized protein n=1 Tax=Linum trigynum TaxID=586398 RepID=A0AAV2EV89_9ROSI
MNFPAASSTNGFILLNFRVLELARCSLYLSAQTLDRLVLGSKGMHLAADTLVVVAAESFAPIWADKVVVCTIYSGQVPFLDLQLELPVLMVEPPKHTHFGLEHTDLFLKRPSNSFVPPGLQIVYSFLGVS